MIYNVESITNLMIIHISCNQQPIINYIKVYIKPIFRG